MGVRRAVEIVLDVANTRAKPIYTFGPLIHNPQVLEILEEKGVSILDNPSQSGPGCVVVRAHGVPPQTKKTLSEGGLTVIDATCPRVVKVQSIIEKYAKEGYGVVIVGDRDHPEVSGLLGYAGGQGHVISEPQDLERLPDFEKAIVVAQTTQDSRLFQTIAQAIKERYPHFKLFNTICDSTHKRQAEVRRMAKSVDAVVVVGGLNSGNTQRLAQVVEQEGIPVYHVEREEELDCEAIEPLHSVGVTAGASTPNWVIKKVCRTLEGLPRRRGRRIVFKVQRWLLLSNLYLALGAGCLSYACALLSGIRPGLPLAMMAACYVLSMHILNNFIGKEAVRYNDPDRAHFYEDNRLVLLTLAALSGAVGLLTAFTMGIVPFLVLLVISILGVLYKVRLFPRPVKIGREIEGISDIPGSKTVLIAMAWGVVTGVLPHLSVSLAITPAMVFVSLWAALVAFVRTAFFDILDMQGDRIVGQESLPILLGERRTLRLLKQLLAFSLVFLLAGALLDIATSLAYGLTLSVFYLAAVIFAFERNWVLPGSRFEFLVETIFVFMAGVSVVWHSFH
jgi:4-hydroxy-3-methylbut-2-enyl diphosphate reductase